MGDFVWSMGDIRAGRAIVAVCMGDIGVRAGDFQFYPAKSKKSP